MASGFVGHWEEMALASGSPVQWLVAASSLALSFGPLGTLSLLASYLQLESAWLLLA